MRTPLLAAAVLLVSGCMSGITGVGDDDDVAGAVCGDGVTDANEQCDDGNDTSGDGCSATCDTETATPRVTAMLDKSTLSTELSKTETVTVNLMATGGFAGDVAVTAKLVDGGDVALPNITVMGPASVTLAANGTGTAAFEINVPMNATGSPLSGTLKVAVSSSAGAQDLSATVAVSNVYTIDYAAGTGTDDPSHMNAGSLPNLVVKRGAILRFHNSDTITHVIHGGGAFPHEDITTGGAPGRTYDVETIGIGPGGSGTLGCHTHDTPTYSTYTVQ